MSSEHNQGSVNNQPRTFVQGEDQDQRGPEDKVSEQSIGQKARNIFDAARRTTENLPAAETYTTRRMTLNPDQSYGMEVKRPPEVETGEYQVVSRPADAEQEESKPALICSACGDTSEEPRLSCRVCGTYFGSTDTRTQSSTWDRVKLDRRVKPVVDVFMTEEKVSWSQMLLMRLVAKGIDLAILSSLLGAVGLSYYAFVERSIEAQPGLEPVFSVMSACLVPAVALLMCVLYNTFFEAGATQATPGKISVRLAVSDARGKALGFSAALWRSVVTMAPVALVVLAVAANGFISLPGGEGEPAELLLSSQVMIAISAVAGLLYFVSLAWMSSNKDMQSLSDVLTDSVVTRRD